MSDKIVITHKDCTDGFASAWLLHLVWPKARFFFCNPGDPLPVLPLNAIGKDVVIADIAFGRDELIALNAACNSLLVLDHHHSNEEKLKDLTFCIFDMQKSGAGLVLEQFATAIEDACSGRNEGDFWCSFYFIQKLIECVEAYDLWNFQVHGAREIHAALACHPFSFDDWDRLFYSADSFSKSSLIADGAAVMRCRNQLVERIISNAKEVTKEFGGKAYRIKTVNSPVLQSEVCEALYKDDPGVIAMAWCLVERNGKTQYRYSLRSLRPDGVDVSEFAGLFGGGGHKHSSGMMTEELIV